MDRRSFLATCGAAASAVAIPVPVIGPVPLPGHVILSLHSFVVSTRSLTSKIFIPKELLDDSVFNLDAAAMERMLERSNDAVLEQSFNAVDGDELDEWDPERDPDNSSWGPNA